MENTLFSRPLIIGASVSAGYGTRDGGPGSVFARMMNPNAKITNLAVSGATSVQSTARLNIESLNPSVVMGFDLFFWDAAREQVGKNFETNTRKVLNGFIEKKIPMIIGKVPVVDFPIARIHGIKKSAEKINSLLEEICHPKTNTVLYDPLNCLMSMKEDHFSDGLHLTPEGNKFCAQFLADSGLYLKLKLP